MNGRHHFGRLYLKKQSRERSTQSTKTGRRLLFVIQIFMVWFVMCAWWMTIDSFLSLQINQRYLFAGLWLVTFVVTLLLSRKRKLLWLVGAGILAGLVIWKNRMLFASAINHLANAYVAQFPDAVISSLYFREWISDEKMLAAAMVLLFTPILLVLAVVLKAGRCRLFAGILLAAPVILAAIEMCFPSVRSCGVLLLAADVYFALTGCDYGGAAFKKGMITIVVLFTVMAVSVLVGGQIEVLKNENRTVYASMKKMTEDQIAAPLKKWTIERRKTVDEPKKEETKKEEQEQQEQLPESAAYGDMENLKSLGSFVPREGELGTLELPDQPEETVYSANTYGEDYNGGAWTQREVSDQVLSGDSMLPDNIERLRAFHDEQAANSLDETESIIRHEFEANTVYSYNPGITPEGQDFAEYFLFENQKGFCVHYATTAVLLYRLYGYPARYVQGYAVEPSEFKQQDNGTWQAKITGAMAHAWCEVYNGEAWVVKEHTLTYNGNEEQVNPPAVSIQQSDEKKGNAEHDVADVVFRILVVILILFVLLIATVAQAAVRRNRMKRSFFKTKGVGMQNMYRRLYRIAVFLGREEKEMKKKMEKDILSSDAFAFMQKKIWYISDEEWLWIYQRVQESLFYNRSQEKEQQIRMYEIYTRAEKQVKNQLGEWKLVKYWFIY
ncbi:MAG: transglutaminase-like domain-containing protein [Hespellia sp.]|nr:transglutaminase-like domain-containing protein [Hespellia sp.]